MFGAAKVGAAFVVDDAAGRAFEICRMNSRRAIEESEIVEEELFGVECYATAGEEDQLFAVPSFSSSQAGACERKTIFTVRIFEDAPVPLLLTYTPFQGTGTGTGTGGRLEDVPEHGHV